MQEPVRVRGAPGCSAARCEATAEVLRLRDERTPRQARDLRGQAVEPARQVGRLSAASARAILSWTNSQSSGRGGSAPG